MGENARGDDREARMREEFAKALEHLRKVIEMGSMGGPTSLTHVERGLRQDAKFVVEKLQYRG